MTTNVAPVREQAAPPDPDTTVIDADTNESIESKLTETENCSRGAGQPSSGTETFGSNANFNASGHKSTDRKTGVGQHDEHYSWQQVYRACEVEVYGHR